MMRPQDLTGGNNVGPIDQTPNTQQTQSLRGSFSVGDETLSVEQLPSNDNLRPTLVVDSDEPQLDPGNNPLPVDEPNQPPLPLNNQPVVPLNLQAHAGRSGWNNFARVVLGGLGALVGGVAGSAAGMAIGGSAGAVGGAVAGIPSGPGAIATALGGAATGGIVGGAVGFAVGAAAGFKGGLRLADSLFGGRPQDAHLNRAITSVQQVRGQNFSANEAHNLNQVPKRAWRKLLHVPNKKWWPGNDKRVGDKADRQHIREALVHYVAKNGLDSADAYKKRLIAAANSSAPNALQSEMDRVGDRVGQTFDQMIDDLANGTSPEMTYRNLEQAGISFLDQAEQQGILDDPVQRGEMLQQKMTESIQRFAQRNPGKVSALRDALGSSGDLAIIEDAALQMIEGASRRRLGELGAKMQSHSAMFRNSMASALQGHDQVVDRGTMADTRTNRRKSERLLSHMEASLPPHRYEHLEARAPHGFMVGPDGRVGGRTDVVYSVARPNDPSVSMAQKLNQHASQYLGGKHIGQTGDIDFSIHAKADLPRMHVRIMPENDNEAYDSYRKEPDEISQKLQDLTGNDQAATVLSGVLNQRPLMPLTTNFVDIDGKPVLPDFAHSIELATVMNNTGDIENVGLPKHYSACQMNVSKTEQGNYRIDVEWPLYLKGVQYVDPNNGTREKTPFPLHGDNEHPNPAIRMTVRTTWEIDGGAANNGELNLRVTHPLTAAFSGRLGPQSEN